MSWFGKWLERRSQGFQFTLMMAAVCLLLMFLITYNPTTCVGPMVCG